MKHFRFRTLLLFVLLPPILYAVSLQAAETWMQGRFRAEIEDRYLGETGPILNGAVPLKQAVARNVDRYLKSLPLLFRGQRIDVTITSRDGTLIYPPMAESPEEPTKRGADPLLVAAENYRLLSRGLVLNLRVKAAFSSPLGLLHLFAFVLISGGGLFIQYRRGLARANEEEAGRKKEIERLCDIRDRYAERMSGLESERKTLGAGIGELKDALCAARASATRNEDAMIEEIGSLEKELEKNLERQLDQEEVIKALQEQIKKAERSGQKAEKQKRRRREMAEKRFQALYKNLSVHERAVDGFLDLAEEMKLRAEEVIHQLDSDKSAITIKRKVFSKRGAVTAFEVVFGRKGRLYFRNSSRRLEVLAIGTKNTQNRDLEFLASV